jgi:hypothetical protein
MPEFEKEEFKFPDEQTEVKVEADEGFEIEIEDDTPPEDRGKKPSDPEFVAAVENDELEEYSDAAKKKISQVKKIMHDERRAKEAAMREQQEAIELARRILEENKALKQRLSTGEEQLISTYKDSAQKEVDMAKREYREAYEAGDTDRIIAANEKLTEAKMKVQEADRFVPTRSTLQEQENEVKIPQQVQQPTQTDTKAEKWRESNTWFGQDEEMTSLALGVHEKLVKENGMAYATTDEYYKRIDATMRKRFPEYFNDEVEVETKKPSVVVAPATRSTSSKKVKLKTSQINLAKKLGLTPEQYAQELIKGGQ